MSGERSIGVEGDVNNSTLITGDSPHIYLPSSAVAPSEPAAKPIRLPYLSIGTLFKGRERLLTELYDSLNTARLAQKTSAVAKVLHGLGGIGKTRLAVEYAYRYSDDYTALLFVGAETPTDLHRNLAALSGEEVPGPSEDEIPEEVYRLDAVLRWLRANPGWLLIFDNVDTEEAANAVEVILAKLFGGDVLITSRLIQWGAGIGSCPIDLLTQADSAVFLLERTAGKRQALATDTSDVEQLAERLGGLALALEQAGAYITCRRVSFAAYSSDWDAQLPAVNEWHDERLMKYPRSVAVTWETTLRHLGLKSEALLRLLSFLAPEQVPLFLFQNEHLSTLLQTGNKLLELERSVEVNSGANFLTRLFACVRSWLGVRPEREENWSDQEVSVALNTLANYSMIRWETDGEEEAVVVHPVVQEIMRFRTPDQLRGSWVRLAIQYVRPAQLGTPENPSHWNHWEKILSHMLKVVSFSDTFGVSAWAHRLTNDIAILFLHKARHREAERLLREVVRAIEADESADQYTLHVSKSNLGQILHHLNEFKEAEDLTRSVITYFEELDDDKSHSVLATAYNNLSQILVATNRSIDAPVLLEKALVLDRRVFGSRHPNIARDLNNLASLVAERGEFSRAEKFYKEALDIQEEVFGPLHPNVASILGNWGLMHLTKGELIEASEKLKRAMDIDLATYGPDHPDIATRLANLAALKEASGEMEDAEELLQRARQVLEETLGSHSISLAPTLFNLSRVLSLSGRPEDALPHSARVLRLLLEFAQKNDRDHSEIEAALDNHLEILQQLGRTELEIQNELSTFGYRMERRN